MNSRKFLCIVVPLLALLLPSACSPHAHESPDSVAQDELEPISATLFGERVLLFVEYPHLVRGEPARFLAHFTVLDSGEPVRSGRVALEVGATVLSADAPKRDGLFTPEGSFHEAGRMRARFVITSDQVSETLDFGEIIVHATPQGARAAAEAGPHVESAGAVPFLLEQQWKLKLLLSQAAPGRLTQRLVVPARVVTAEGASAVVAAPVSGRLLPPASGTLAVSGEKVEAGQELALVEPLLSAADAAQLRALTLEWSIRSLEVERESADATVKLKFAQLEHERIAKLRPSGLATQQRLDQAEHDMSLARTAMDAAHAARDALDELRASHGDSYAESPDGTLRFRVLAPISGVVVGAGRVLGESLEAGNPLLRIVDDSRLWIEGRVSEFDVMHLRAAPHAAVTLPALPGHRLDVGGTPDSRLLSLGPEIDDTTRTLVVRYELPDPEGRVRPGMLADLEIAVDVKDAAVVIPFGAVVMDQGLPTAYVMLSGETFQRRDLELGLRDGELVEVLAGVTVGERVATRGAATIRMAAMSPSSFGAQHAH